jgi:hypothetical protein|tara:strand:- start:198 stop:764 length:567 start_codon:yes stop_codon:yes gene_type:complete
MNYYKQKQLLLALFIMVLLMTVSIFSHGQTTINPDTVCANAVGEQYFVTNTPTSTYNWTVTGGGTIQTGQTTNTITVDWGGVAGLWANAIEVTESNAAGCPGSPILLDVFVLDLTSNIIGPFCPGDPSASLVGNPAGGTWSGTGVTGNNFDPTVGIGNYTLTYILAGCSTTINVVVNGGPITGPIQHF